MIDLAVERDRNIRAEQGHLVAPKVLEPRRRQVATKVGARTELFDMLLIVTLCSGANINGNARIGGDL